MIFGPIPACAGQPQTANVVHAVTGAYPRVCGATGGTQAHDGRRGGLSPRVRGNPYDFIWHWAGGGPIPACAGQPLSADLAITFNRAYPRVCGATSNQPAAAQAFLGLSPRVRGNHCHHHADSYKDGPIPACAGQPGISPPSQYFCRAYPRVCGATLRRGIQSGNLPGLSPRVRGNLPMLLMGRAIRGPIPACAGQPWRSVWHF